MSSNGRNLSNLLMASRIGVGGFNGKKHDDDRAKEMAWSYFSARFRGLLPNRDEFDTSDMALRGPLSDPDDTGKRYHGDRDRKFTVWAFGQPLAGEYNVTSWNPWSDTCDTSKEFCGNSRPCGLDAEGNQICECQGHEPEIQPGAPAGSHANSDLAGGLPDGERDRDFVPLQWWSIGIAC